MRAGARCQAADGSLTLQVLPGPGQEVVEDVEGPFFLGLTDSTGLLQEIWDSVKEAPQFPPSFPQQKLNSDKIVKTRQSKLPGFYPWVGMGQHATWEPFISTQGPYSCKQRQ